MKLCITTAILPVMLAAALGQVATTQPRATSQPTTTTAPSVDPAVRKILDAMETAGKTIKTIRADLSYQDVNTSLGDKWLRTGWLAYQGPQTVGSGDKARKLPPKFRVHFETLKLGRGKTVRKPVDYIYDGENLTIVRAATKTITRFQVPPELRGAKMLQLGKGPLPLPFGQKTADMIKFFKVTTRPARAKDKGTVYLNLVPRKAHAKRLNCVYIHMWVSTTNHLPVKLVLKDKSKNVTTVTFSKVRTREILKKALFTIRKPAGWKLVVQPLKGNQNLKP